MKLSGISVALLILLLLLIMQSIGGYLQIQDYRRTVRRMRQLGNLGMGQRRGKVLNGHVAIVACDSNGIITGCEVLPRYGQCYFMTPEGCDLWKIPIYSSADLADLADYWTSKRCYQK